MGKRKQQAPRRASEDKRKCLSWNMMDNASNNEGDLINDKIDVIDLTTTSDEATKTVCETHVNARKSVRENNGNLCFGKDELLDIFNLHVENCLFSFPIYSTLELKDNGWKCILAEFSLNFSPSPVFVPLPSNSLPEIRQFTLHVSSEGEKNVLCYHVQDSTSVKNSKKGGKSKGNISGDVKFWLVDTNIPVHVLEAFKWKKLVVAIDRFNSSNMSIHLKVIGTESFISHLSYPSEAIRPISHVKQSMKHLMEYFFGISAPGKYAQYLLNMYEVCLVLNMYLQYLSFCPVSVKALKSAPC